MLPQKILISDHLNGFDCNFENQILRDIDNQGVISDVYLEYILDDCVKERYKNINFKFDLPTWLECNVIDAVHRFKQETIDKDFRNFVCSFNSSEHVSRQLLLSILYKFKWLNNGYYSKNFSYTVDRLDGNLMKFLPDLDDERFYRKFFIDPSPETIEFYNSITFIGEHKKEPNRASANSNHEYNLTLFYEKINSSFVQIVGEVVGTSYYPFFTEKFLYPIIAKTLWVAYAPPKYHHYNVKYLGFKQYEKIFDYAFDDIENPVKRLVELITMLSKFEKLTVLDWHDLYLLEQDTIEFNYHHYKSRNYIKSLEKYV